MSSMCLIDGCDRPPVGRGLCKPHYYRERRLGTLEHYAKLPPPPPKLCSVVGCTKKRHAHGLCPTHLKRLRDTGTTDPTDTRSFGLDEAFQRYVGAPNENGCTEWTGYRLAFGYGRLKKDGALVSAHRYSYERAFGPIPEGGVVRHACDNPPCVNPDHLLVGDVQDNVDDCVSRGRQNRGREVNTSKLTEDEVRGIRKSALPTQELADKYGVALSTIIRIRNRKTWAWLLD